MEPIKPSISVEYTENATIVTLAEEKILEETDIRALQESIMSVIEQAERMNLILNFGNVRFLSSAVLGLLWFALLDGRPRLGRKLQGRFHG